MNIFDRKPALRWVAPLAFVAVVGGTGGLYATATAGTHLTPLSAQALLVHLQQAKVDGFSGTLQQTSDLGLSLPGLGGSADASLTSLLTGNHTLDVWYAGQDKSRLAVRGDGAESDVIVNGSSVWQWSSKDQTATHRVMTAPKGAHPQTAPTGAPATPAQAAKQALAAVDPTTSVTTADSTKVAGRAAYELVLAPKDRGSLVKEVRIAVDGVTYIPLRVEIVDSANKAAFTVGFTKIDFSRPDDRQFVFKAPPNTKVTESAPNKATAAHKVVKRDAKTEKMSKADQPKISGKGWSTIAVSKMTTKTTGQLGQMVNRLPRTPANSGVSGRVLTSALFSAVLTDDGRVAVGSVKPDLLYAALLKK